MADIKTVCAPACAPNVAENIPGVNPDPPTPPAPIAGIEIGFAPVGCTYDAGGNQTGQVFVAETRADEPGSPSTYRQVHVATDGTVTDPFTGTWEDCTRETLPPQQFCFTTTSTGDVEHPGRRYEIELPINPGFAVESLLVDAVTSPANIVWNVNDPDGATFATTLANFINSRVPAAATVTVNNPNAGNGQVCGTAQPMTIVIECLRLDSNPPNLIELLYNRGRDLILNPAYNEDPPLTPPVSQGNYGFHLLAREDDPGPFPGNPPSERANCTNVANRGWETNDVGRTFEIWGQNIVQGEGVVPTPRGTPVQEMTSDGPPPGGLSTIWQTFQVTTAADFTVRVVHGGRDVGETHRITLSNGDTDDNQIGDLINNVVNNIPQVTTNGGQPSNPWTTFNQVIPLNPGIYTLALSTTNPVGGARGGLFTDMRAFQDVPGQRATADVDDETCVVTTEETVTTTVCEFWAPQIASGNIVGWRNAATGEVRTNAAFWGNVPAPSCCTSSGGEGDSGSVSAGNLTNNYDICGVVGGVTQTLQRIVITDQSGGVVAESIIGTDGAPVSPTSWQPGPCPAAQRNVVVTSEPGCADGVPFTRTRFHQVNENGSIGPITFNWVRSDGIIETVAPANWTLGECPPESIVEYDTTTLCDPNTADPILVVTTYSDTGIPTSLAYNIDGTPYAGAIGDLVVCAGNTVDTSPEVVCDNGATNFIRWYVMQGGVPTGAAFDTDIDGQPYVATGPVTLGACTLDAVVEIDQYDTAPVPVCYDSPPGTVTTWHTYERVLFNNTDPGTEVSRVRHWTNGTIDVTVEPVGDVVVCKPETADTTIEPGCADGVPWNRVTRRTYYGGVPIAVTVGWVDSNGAVVNVAPVNFTLGACEPDAGLPEVQVLATAEPGCVNGVPYTRMRFVYTDLQGQQLAVVVGFHDSDGVETPAQPDFVLGACPDPVATPVTYTTTVQDVTAAPVTINDGGNLYSWTVRNRTATTATVQVNGGTVLTLDPFETMSASVMEENSVLTDDFTVNPGDGSVRVTIIRRN